MTLPAAGYPDFLRVSEGSQVPFLADGGTVRVTSPHVFGTFFLGNATALACSFLTTRPSQLLVDWLTAESGGISVATETWDFLNGQTLAFVTGAQSRFVRLSVLWDDLAFPNTITAAATATTTGGFPQHSNPGGLLLPTAFSAVVAAGATAAFSGVLPYRGLATLAAHSSATTGRVALTASDYLGAVTSLGGMNIPVANTWAMQQFHVPPLIVAGTATNTGGAGSTITVQITSAPAS